MSKRILHISDTHFFKDPTDLLLGVNTQDSFQAVLDLIRHENNIDMIIHTGDLSNDGSQASYARLADMLDQLTIPIYCVPGNHDDARMLGEVFKRKNFSSARHIVPNQHWQIILLNSQKPGAVNGWLKPEEFQHLQSCLENNNEHAIIMFHHQPVLVGSKWLDKLGLKNADEFWQLLSQYHNVQMICFGHVHQEFQKVVNGIPCYSVPSTCIQFKRHSETFALEKLPPGFRIIDLHDDGSIKTKVIRAQEYVGVFDKNAKGY